MFTGSAVDDEKKMTLESIHAIRGLNRDYVALNCDQKKNVPCANIVAAMQRLSLPSVLPKDKSNTSTQVDLGPCEIESKPPTLILQTDAISQATCTKRCGILGSVLASALATTALTTNAVADLGVAENQRDIVAQAGAAAGAVVAVSLCSRFCEPGSRQQTFDAEGSYLLKGQYTATAQTKTQLDEFKAKLVPTEGREVAGGGAS